MKHDDFQIEFIKETCLKFSYLYSMIIREAGLGFKELRRY